MDVTSGVQLGLWATSAEDLPPGLVFEPAFLTTTEEQLLLAQLERLEFHPIVLHGVAARRGARHFGLDYDYEQRTPQSDTAEPLPDWLDRLRTRSAEFAALDPDGLVEALVQRYPPGASIGWHRDAPSFGLVIGISLGAPARLRFRRGSRRDWTIRELALPPRSLYILKGESRTSWQHSIPPQQALRYSITFRTLQTQFPGAKSPAATA